MVLVRDFFELSGGGGCFLREEKLCERKGKDRVGFLFWCFVDGF